MSFENCFLESKDYSPQKFLISFKYPQMVSLQGEWLGTLTQLLGYAVHRQSLC